MNLSFPKFTYNFAISKVVIIFCFVLIGLMIYYHMTRSNTTNETFTSNDVNNNESQTDNSNPLVPSGNDLTLALFYADWCPHCVSFKPTFEGEIKTHIEQTDFPNRKVRVVSVNAETEEELAKLYNISGFPTLFLIDSSGKATEYQGDRTADGIEKFIKSL